MSDTNIRQNDEIETDPGLILEEIVIAIMQGDSMRGILEQFTESIDLMIDNKIRAAMDRIRQSHQ